MSHNNRWWVGEAVQRSAVGRSIFAASGPGVQANDTAPGAFDMPFQHVTKVRFTVPAQYDQILAPIVSDRGVRITEALCPATGDKKTVAIDFDGDTFSPDQARAWLAAHELRDFTLLADSRDQVPTTQGSPRDESEKPPQGFSGSIKDFYEATVPVEDERAFEPTAADVARAGRRLGLDFVAAEIASYHK